jgi:enoyl-CoA hydratase/carnithine racemase
MGSASRPRDVSPGSEIRLDILPPVATVWMDGPSRLNVLDVSGWRAIVEVLSSVSTRNDLTCVVLRGAGSRAFSAGSDIHSFESQRNTPDQVREYAKSIASALEAIRSCPHPTLALIEGICVGGGLEIAACCDLRVCGTSSRFGAPIHRLGLTMSYEELRPLLQLLGPGPLLDLLLSGELIDSERALAVGLVSRVWPDELVSERASELVSRITAGAPLVNRWHKKFVRRLAEGTPITFEEREEAHEAFQTDDYREGTLAFLEKRSPTFRGV